MQVSLRYIFENGKITTWQLQENLLAFGLIAINKQSLETGM
jgi:hypothetical protein